MRAAAAYCALALVGVDDRRATKLIELVTTDSPDEILASQAVLSCLENLIQRTPDFALPLVRRMLESEVERVSYLGGSLAAVAWLTNRTQVEEWTAAGAAARAGAVSVLARQVRFTEHEARCERRVRAAFSDQAERV